VAEYGSNSTWCAVLYDEQAAGLLLLGRALGLSHSEAEDVLHETFLALLKLGAKPENPAGYSVQTYRRRAINHRRSWWRRLLREPEAGRWFEPAEGETDRERAAMRALAGLPAEQREAVVLKVWNGMTFDEIGDVTGVSPNTAAGRYRYGIEKLRRAAGGTNFLLEDDKHEHADESPGTAWFLDTQKAVARPQGAAV
jgi:RNA polymerase sigma-70 factor, ECF subfamily